VPVFASKEDAMKRGLVPGGAVFLGLIVSLAALGVGYGLFSDTLRINGAVVTGSVNAGFSLHELDEGLARGVAGGPTDNGVNEDREAGGLDVAECYARPLAVTAADTADVAPVDDDASLSEDVISLRPRDFLYVVVKNGYPSFNCYVDFDVHNAGNIPVKVSKPVLGPVPDPRVMTVEFQRCYEDGVQVEPGKEVLCTLHLHIERGAQPNTLYRFGATICAWQWNTGNAVRCAIPTDIEPLPADLDAEIGRPAPRP
jgi:hypothetical protein